MNPNDQKIYRYTVRWKDTFIARYEILINNVHYSYVSSIDSVSFSILLDYLGSHDMANDFYIKFCRYYMGERGNYNNGKFCGLFIGECIDERK